MNGLPQHDVRRLRLMRLGALAIAWVVPVLIAAVSHGSVADFAIGLVYPSVRKAILLVGIGLQVYRLVRPSSGQPRVYEYVESQGEIAILGMLLFFNLGLGATNQGLGGDAIQWGFSIANWLMLLGLFAGRTRVVIDGSTRTVTIGDLVPRTKSFDQVRGLGTIAIRHLRNGAHTGTTYRVGLFMDAGKPKQLDPAYSMPELDQKIGAIAAETGLQVARA